MDEGGILIITNPVAKTGAGKAAGARCAQLLRAALPHARIDEASTRHAGHACELAREASDEYGTVVVVGGDGVVHEVAGGLMERESGKRPTLGLVPVGSGNDYAHTLGMSQDVDTAVSQLLSAGAHPMDVGEVNGTYFVETLSFGLDAAIAIDTIQRRLRTSKTGGALYFEAGIDQLLHHFKTLGVSATLDGERTIAADVITFAIQIGPTYGGGFLICPDARADDGLFDICYSLPTGRLRAIWIFVQAKGGKHVNAKPIRFAQARRIHLDFDEPPAAQADGEQVEGRSFDVRMHERALNVIAPAYDA